MKTSLIVEARSSSSRLPGKILMEAKKGTTFLEYLISRLKLLKFVDDIIIATTRNPKDISIANIAKKMKVKHYRGSEQNVLLRVIQSAKKFKSNVIVRITSDCPMIDLDIVKQLYKIYKNNNVDYVSNSFKRSYPLGMDAEIFSLKTLKKSYKYARSDDCKQHITLAIRRNSKIFKHINLIAPKNLNYPNIAITLDEYEDYIFLIKLITKFKKKNYTCKELLEYLHKNPSLLNINKKVKRTKYNYNKK